MAYLLYSPERVTNHDPSPEASRDTGKTTISAVALQVAIAITTLVLLGRAPALWWSPRLWAEEGTIYFSYAYTHGLFGSLFAPHLYYYTGITNAGTLLAARAVPIEWAPTITTATALLCQITPLSVVLTTWSPLWNNDLRRLLACAAILLFPSGEIWLTTLSANFHLSLAAALILLVDLRTLSRLKRALFDVLLATASVAGPCAAFLLPVYAITARAERSRERWRQCVIVLAGFAIQVTAFTWTVIRNGPPPERLNDFSWRLFRDIYVDGALAHTVLFQRFYREFPELNWVVAVAIVVTCLAARRHRATRTAVLAAIALSAIALLTSEGMRGGERYFFASSVLWAIVWIALLPSAGSSTSLVALLSSVLLACSLVRAGWTFKQRMELFDRPTAPAWRSEVAHWRKDPRYRPRIPPDWGGEWRIDLAR